MKVYAAEGWLAVLLRQWVPRVARQKNCCLGNVGQMVRDGIARLLLESGEASFALPSSVHLLHLNRYTRNVPGSHADLFLFALMLISLYSHALVYHGCHSRCQ